MNIWKPVYTLVQCEKTQQLSLVRVQPCHPDKSIFSEKNSLFSVIFWLDKPKSRLKKVVNRSTGRLKEKDKK